MSKKKKTEYVQTDALTYKNLGIPPSLSKGIASLNVAPISGATMENYLTGNVEFKSLQGLTMPNLKLDSHFPINIPTPERKDDIIFFNTERNLIIG